MWQILARIFFGMLKSDPSSRRHTTSSTFTTPFLFIFGECGGLSPSNFKWLIFVQVVFLRFTFHVIIAHHAAWGRLGRVGPTHITLPSPQRLNGFVLFEVGICWSSLLLWLMKQYKSGKITKGFIYWLWILLANVVDWGVFFWTEVKNKINNKTTILKIWAYTHTTITYSLNYFWISSFWASSVGIEPAWFMNRAVGYDASS